MRNATPQSHLIGEIFSPKKIFSTKIGNALGLQVCRVLLARVIANRRRRTYPWGSSKEEQALAEHGYAVIPEFLSQGDFQRVQQEYERAMGPIGTGRRVIRDTRGYIRESVYVSPQTASLFPHTYQFVYQNERLRTIFATSQACSNTSFDEGVFQAAFWRNYLDDEGSIDALESDHTNSELHADTFHTITKAFFYLEAADDGNGAHKYVPYSHLLCGRRLWFEYLNSIGPQEGSPRLTQEWLRRFGLPVVSLCYPPNTLIVVNTFGFHQAGSFARGRDRKVVYAQYRRDPFR